MTRDQMAAGASNQPPPGRVPSAGGRGPPTPTRRGVDAPSNTGPTSPDEDQAPSSQAPPGYGGGSSQLLASPVSPPANNRWNSFSSRGEKGKHMVMGVLSSALDLAKAAVSHDEQGMLPHKVLPYYKKAIRAIDAALKLLPEHVAESTGIKRHRNNYQARVDKLSQEVKRDSQQRERRARQSRVKFSMMELNANYSIEPEPSQPTRRSYWVLRLVRATIFTGGYLTPTLYAPKDVWTQVGVKVSGFPPRIAALDTVLTMIIDRVEAKPKPLDAEGRKDAVKVLRGFREEAHKLQTDLSRHFGFIVPVDQLGLARELEPKSNLGRLNTVMKSIGRNVKNTAVGAVERIGAGIQGKNVDDELVYYRQIVAELCDKCQVFDEWFLHLQDQVARNDTDEMDDLLLELHFVASFMREVVCAMILRDLETLVERYLRKMRKSAVRMYWDDDYDDYDEEQQGLA